MFDFRSFQLKSRPWKKNLYGIIIFLVRVFLRFPPTYFPIVCDWGPVFLSASSQWAALQPWRQVFTAGDVRDGGVHLPVPSISVRRNLCTSAWLTLQPLLDSFITRNLSWAIVEQSCFSLRYQLLSFISEKDPRMGTPRGLCFSPLHSKNPGLPPLPPVEQLARLCCSFQATLGFSAPGGSPSPQWSVLLCASKLLSRVPPPRCACLLWTRRLLEWEPWTTWVCCHPLSPGYC